MPRLRSYDELLLRHLDLTVIPGRIAVNHRSLSTTSLTQCPLRPRMHPRGTVPDESVPHLMYFGPYLMPECPSDMSFLSEIDSRVLMMMRSRRVNRYRRLVLVVGR